MYVSNLSLFRLETVNANQFFLIRNFNSIDRGAWDIIKQFKNTE